MKDRKQKNIPYQKRKELYGYGFISLWLVGTLFFFVIPLIKSLCFSFSEVSIGSGKLTTEWVGLKKYIYVLTVDEKYTKYLGDMLLQTLWKTPLVLIFSLFIAVIINQKFRGRTLARAIFFLPVIVATGPVYKIINGDMHSTGNTGAAQFSTLFSTDLVGELLQFLGIYGISENMNSMISAIADNVFGIVWASGIQILLFLAALQNISPSVREAAEVEGATSWEFFWKISFPCVSPYTLAAFIFTLVDSFKSTENTVMHRIHDMKEDLKFGEASAMAWIYFVIILASIALVTCISNRHIYYEVD